MSSIPVDLASARHKREARGAGQIARLLWLLLVFFWGQIALGWADAQPITSEVALADRLDAGSAHALIIGVSTFDSFAWPRLAGVEAEVAKITGALKDQGFTTHFPTVDADGRLTKQAIRAAVDTFVRDFGSSPGNRLVIYFATHGMKEDGGTGLLIASDTLAPDAAGFPGSAYSVAELSRDLALMQARHLFLFVNACFSGTMLPAMGTKAYSRGGGDPVSEIDKDRSAWALRLLDEKAWLVLTAGSDDQEVPDRNNPFATAIAEGLDGAADLDGDGLILGSEIAQHVRSSVALATLATGQPNDPVFAIMPGSEDEMRPASLQGDFVFLAPNGPADKVDRSAEAILAARNQRLPGGQFTDCADCPVMVALPARGDAGASARLALGRTEVTYSEWDACYREFSCRYLQDDGLGRGNRAVGGVTWADAQDFLEWMNNRRGGRCTAYRLPALSEWQAALGTVEAGQSVCRDCGAAGGLSASAAAGAASLPANVLGLHDMAGNLWEWVAGPEPACSAVDLAKSGRCAVDGTVVGGGFSTKAIALPDAAAGASYPRLWNQPTGGQSVMGQSVLGLPSIGLRVACDLAAKD